MGRGVGGGWRKGGEQGVCQEAEDVYPASGPAAHKHQLDLSCRPWWAPSTTAALAPHLLWALGSDTVVLALPLALRLLFVLEPWPFLTGCDGLPWLSVLCDVFGGSPCSSSMDLDTGHLASTLSRPALTPREGVPFPSLPREAVEDFSKDIRIE